MLAYDPAPRLMLPHAPQHQHTARDGALDAHVRATEARLGAAERALPNDSDAAALLLSRMLGAIAALWFACRARRASPLQPKLVAHSDLVEPLQSAPMRRDSSYFGLRLWLAPRAPNVEARLAHCRHLLRLIAEDEGDEHHVS